MLPQPYFISIGEIAPDPRWYMPPHAHGFWEMIVPISGIMSVIIAGQEIQADQQHVMLYPRGVAHEERSEQRYPVATRFFSFGWDCPTDTFPLCVFDTGARLHQIVAWMAEDRDLAESPAVRARRESLLQLALAHYAVCAAHNPEDDRLVREIRTHVREHLADDLTLGRLAEVAGLSRFHFLRIYQRLAGRPPMADVRAIRLEHARQLLLSTDLPLKAIAPRCGMGSEFALSRAYKRHFGHNPSTLRRRP